MPKKNKLMFFITIVAVFALLLFAYLKKEKCSSLDCISFSSKKTYQLKEVFNDQDNSYLAEYSNQDSILRVEVVDQGNREAESLIRARIARIKNQYEENISPYPGEISDSISCPPEFKPNVKTYEENNIRISSFLIKLNERMVSGQCEESLIKYHSHNYYFHCPNQDKTFLVEMIYDKNFGEVEQPVFSCN